MISIPMKTTGAVNRQTVMSINQNSVQEPKTSRNIKALNNGKINSAADHVSAGSAGQFSEPQHISRPSRHNITAPASDISSRPMPDLQKPVQKGQKVVLENGFKLSKIQAGLGWTVINPACDVDVSAFLLTQSGKVMGDDWFVFYGQNASPDRSVIFSVGQGQDRETISVDFTKLNSNVSKIVFVMTIHEALEKRLNFSMLKDAYIRIINSADRSELVSFRIPEYYSNVTSMVIGELYRHNGSWKFSAIGNGLARDLAGLCDFYGVQVI